VGDRAKVKSCMNLSEVQKNSWSFCCRKTASFFRPNWRNRTLGGGLVL